MGEIQGARIIKPPYDMSRDDLINEVEQLDLENAELNEEVTRLREEEKAKQKQLQRLQKLWTEHQKQQKLARLKQEMAEDAALARAEAASGKRHDVETSDQAGDLFRSVALINAEL